MATMMKVIAVGNLGRDPKLTKNEDQKKSFVDFSIATEEYDAQGTKDAGKTTYKTVWWGCRMYGARAEYLAEHARKGSTVYLEADPPYVTHRDDKTYLNLRVQSALLLSRSAKSSEGSSNESSAPQTESAPQTQASAPTTTQRSPASPPAPAQVTAAAAAAVADLTDDDLPF